MRPSRARPRLFRSRLTGCSSPIGGDAVPSVFPFGSFVAAFDPVHDALHEREFACDGMEFGHVRLIGERVNPALDVGVDQGPLDALAENRCHSGDG
jgi:hypothetical protein